MKVVGITGSIGMGKSTLSRMVRQMRIPLHDADATVHRLMAPGGRAVAAIAAAFPGVQKADGAIDRPTLGGHVFGNTPALQRLEAILHPLVRADKAAFVQRARRRRVPLVMLDVPLLFETDGDAYCDAVLVVSAPAFIQKQRVMARPGMTEFTFRQVLGRQMPDVEKRRRADYVIPSGRGLAVTRRALRRALRDILATPNRP
jgi:dephospho-CoA kinase